MFIFRFIILLFLALSFPLYSVNFEEMQKSDAHFHLLDFLQNSDYMSADGSEYIVASPNYTPAVGDRGGRIRAMLKFMDESNVYYTTVFGMPFLKKWSRNETFRSGYYLDSSSRVVISRDTDYIVALAIQDFIKDNPDSDIRDRLFPFIGGFDSTDLGAVDMVIKRIKEFPGIWEGVGEVMSRHDDLTNLTTGERPMANHPSVHRLSDFSGEVFLPVSIHHNIAPISPSGAVKPPLYLAEFIDLVDQHPNTMFIWCHAGISRRIKVANLPKIIDDFLTEKQRYKHVFIDLSWVVYDDYIYSERKGVDNRDVWAQLVEKYPTTFMMGSDKVGKFNGYDKELDRFIPFLETLSERQNGEGLIKGFVDTNFSYLMLELRKKRGGSGVVLDPSYRYSETKFVID